VFLRVSFAEMCNARLLHSAVSILDSRIGDEGAKALGDALKDNTALTSLSLDLRCE
jgi:hypothetical protein